MGRHPAESPPHRARPDHEENLLEAVIGLSANLFFGTGIPAAILIFNKARTTGDVLFIDASREYREAKNQNILTDEHVQKIVSTYAAFQIVEKYAYRAIPQEIADNDFNLNIPRYVDTFEEEAEIDLISSPSNVFEKLKRVNEHGSETWSARELAKILEYSEFRHFLPVIAKAREACEKSGHKIQDHFEEMLDMVEIGSGAQRPVENWLLSRYACYLVIQNADPSKPLVALGQTYFAVQTRRQELTDADAVKEEKMRLLLRDEMLGQA